MQLPDDDIANRKNKLVRLAQKSVRYSWLESALPRIFPFFKLGLSNSVILCALNFSPKPFFKLTFLKTLTANLIGGTLFSPFFLISLIQSFFSASLMYFIAKLPQKLISIYGISIFGAAASSIIQIFLYRFYLGAGTETFLAPMLIFSIFSGCATAFLANKIQKEEESDTENQAGKNTKVSFDEIFNDNLNEDFYLFFTNFSFTKKRIIFILGFCLLAAFIFATDNFPFLLTTLFIALAIQIKKGQKIKVLPYIFLWIFVVISALLTPQGKILFKFMGFSFTQDALINGIIKALKLSASSALSHVAVSQISIQKKRLTVKND